MKKITYITLAAAMIMASCSNDSDENTSRPVAAEVTAGVNNPATRANGNSWEADEIGVMAVSVSGTPAGITSTMTSLYKNVHYTTSSTTAEAAAFTATVPSSFAAGQTTAYGIFFQDATETVTFAAYAPYQQSTDANILPGTNGVISQNTASQATRDDQKTFDFIFATGATASKASQRIQFSDSYAFTHVMTRLIIKVQTSANDGFTAADVTSGTYTLTGITHDGTFDVNPASTTFGKATASTVTSGTATVPGSSAAGQPWSLTANAISTTADNTLTFDAILFPQTAGTLDFEALIDGQSYKCQISPALEAGKSYTYTITAKKQGLTVEGCKVNDWTAGTTENNGEADAK